MLRGVVKRLKKKKKKEREIFYLPPVSPFLGVSEQLQQQDTGTRKHLCMRACSVVSDFFVTPWTLAHQAPLSMGSYSQEYWYGLPFPSPGDQTHISCISRSILLPLSLQGSPRKQSEKYKLLQIILLTNPSALPGLDVRLNSLEASVFCAVSEIQTMRAGINSSLPTCVVSISLRTN